MHIYYRWSDNDHRWGRFIYASDGSSRSFAVSLSSSGDEDEQPFATLRLSAFRRSLIVILPPIIKPYRHWVDTSRWSNDPKGGYWDQHRRAYGFNFFEGALHVDYGEQTNDSSTDKSKCYFLPWKQWRHVRHSLYDLAGDHFATLPEWGFRHKNGWEVRNAIEAVCPTHKFEFADFDGEQIIATTKIEERQWKRGEGKFKWLSWFWPDKVRRSLDLQFSAEVGRRKGSWKGGTIGHSIDMLPGELHEAAFRRYCEQNGLKFVAPVDTHPQGGDGTAPFMGSAVPKGGAQ